MRILSFHFNFWSIGWKLLKSCHRMFPKRFWSSISHEYQEDIVTDNFRLDTHQISISQPGIPTDTDWYLIVKISDSLVQNWMRKRTSSSPSLLKYNSSWILLPIFSFYTFLSNYNEFGILETAPQLPSSLSITYTILKIFLHPQLTMSMQVKFISLIFLDFFHDF